MPSGYRLRATILPDGTAPTDLWIAEGRLYHSPRPGCEPLVGQDGTDGSELFISAGLVDAHAHVAYLHEPGSPPRNRARIERRRQRYARRGVLLLRDMGSSDDGLLELTLRGDGLPTVLAAGMMLQRDSQPPLVATAPEDLVSAAVSQARRGASWVKLFADWADEYRGRADNGHSGFDAPTYPPELIAEATAAVHREGARVALHCFTAHGARTGVEAGVDSLEHAWGLTRELIDTLARRTTTAWVPTLALAPIMRMNATRFGETERAAWIESAMAQMYELVPYAHRKGVPILVGTDWFPRVTVGDEVLALARAGLDAADAIASASTVPRAFLGMPAMQEGAPADVAIYDVDPRSDPSALDRPRWVLMGGVPVSPRVDRAPDLADAVS